jgi:D-lactate dehydrogenase (cytochrome)
VNVESLLSHLGDCVDAKRFSTQIDNLRVASKDESSFDGVVPLAVVWPLNAEEITQILFVCNEFKVPATVRGGGSALEGSAIPSDGGIVVDVSRMTKIRSYWPEDLQVQVEPGIIYDDLNASLKKDGLFFPPSPGGSGNLATIGGMVATNASGIYSVRYGGTKDHILAMDIVCADGRQMTLGNRAVKRSSGYNLVDLLCGSEGTLAVITSVTLKLAGLPEHRRQSAYRFESEQTAAKAVSEIRRYGIDVAAIEFLDRRVIEALNLLKQYGLTESPTLLFEFHGTSEGIASAEASADEICKECGGASFKLPEGQNPWEIRHYVTESIKHRKPGHKIIRNDVAFPISQLPAMVAYCYEAGRRHNVMIHAFGHVGMGLLHALILANPKDEANWKAAQTANEEIICKSVALQGTVSGEHGIGVGHKRLLAQASPDEVAMMRQMKRVWDPLGILNPGKIFDL